MREPYDKAAVQVARRQGSTYSTVSVGTERSPQNMRLITQFVKDDNGQQWVIQVPYPLGEIEKALRTLSQTLLLLLPIGLALTAAACLFLMKYVMRPIREITATSDSISAEDLSGRLAVKGTDEFAQLGLTINGMLGRLEAAFSVQRETMARLEVVLKQQRRFTADASHELKTPLAVIKANTGLMLHGSDLSEDTRASVQSIDSAATRMNRLVQGLMLLARTEAGGPPVGEVPFDLKLTVQNALDHVHRAPGKAIRYSDDGGESFVNGSERDMERVFVNLLDNACRHTSDTGNIMVDVRQQGDLVIATIRDDGEGIASEHIPHLFDRFYRVDSARSSETGGTGLGLAICKGIVEATNGTIEIESQLGAGTTVTVSLPVAR
jgi:signal transduction histidine kinase